jgi:archaellum component FlaG (FlaF/FlaG flagellin family)
MKYEDSSWKSKLRAWDQGGKGAYRDYTAGENRIYDIKILPDETLLIAGGLPEWIRMKRSGETIINKKAENYNFLSRDTAHLKVTPDGQSILFKPLGGPSCAFSVATETFTELKDGEASPFPLAVAAKTEAQGISLTDWNLTTQPKLNGKALTFLARGERTSSVAISGRTSSIIVGADYNLYGVSYSGAMLWKVATPSTIYAVNVADSIQVAVASLGDGTIRWYRISDGKELLALYVNKITKRWILWTPSGYFNASPGGSTLVGWHMNNGINKASDFFSADRFSDRYYRPEITKSVLQYGDELVAVNEANKDKIVRPTTSIQNALPPVVSLIAPSDGEDISTATVKVSALIRAPKGTKVTEIKTLVDGRPVENNTRGIEIRPKDDAGEVTNLTVTIPDTQSGTYRISVLAKNENGWSEPSTVRVRLQATESFSIKPKLYVLSVGVGKYDDAALTLKYPAKDAMDFANALKRQSSLLYREVVVKTLVDKQATKDDILDGLDWIQQETTAKDIAMVFFAGHGVNDQNGIFYFLPSDADTQRLKRTCVPFTDIKNTVSSLAGKALFFVDTCIRAT